MAYQSTETQMIMKVDSGWLKQLSDVLRHCSDRLHSAQITVETVMGTTVVTTLTGLADSLHNAGEGAKLAKAAAKFRKMPDGGPMLRIIPQGIVAAGQQHIATFTSEAAAVMALQEVASRTPEGWRVRPD